MTQFTGSQFPRILLPCYVTAGSHVIDMKGKKATSAYSYSSQCDFDLIYSEHCLEYLDSLAFSFWFVFDYSIDISIYSIPS